MRKRWIVLAIVFGLVAAAPSFWPSSPLWRNTYRFDCAVEEFTSDSRAVLSIEQAFTDTPSTAPLRLHRCDADTGKSLGVVDLPLPDSTELMETKLSPDATTLLLLMMKEKHDSNDLQVVRSYFYFLHDAHTGRMLAGPIPLRATPGLFFTISANCQWLWINNITASDTRDGFDVSEACTGQLVLRVRRQGAAVPLCLRFASDNSAIAVLWKNSCKDLPAAYFVQIIDLPSGKERRRVNLPASPW